MEEATLELSLVLPYVVAPVLQGRTGDGPDTRPGSEWMRRFEEVIRLGVRIHSDARWPMPRAKTIRQSALDTVGRLGAMTLSWTRDGAEVTSEAFDELLERQPSSVVFGGTRQEIADHVERYKAQLREERSETS